MSPTAQILHDSLHAIVAQHPQITPRFYEILWSRYPQVRPLFHRSPPEVQAKMLQDTIVAAVDHVDDAAWLASNLRHMGRQHVEYGVTAEMYGWVGECLLATLAELAGPAWTPEVAATWAATYGAIAGLMQEGAATA